MASGGYEIGGKEDLRGDISKECSIFICSPEAISRNLSQESGMLAK